MFKSQESMSYAVGGAAMGVTVGIMVGKYLSSSTSVKPTNVQMQYLQNPMHLQGHCHLHCCRSKSMPRHGFHEQYENGNIYHSSSSKTYTPEKFIRQSRKHYNILDKDKNGLHRSSSANTIFNSSNAIEESGRTSSQNGGRCNKICHRFVPPETECTKLSSIVSLEKETKENSCINAYNSNKKDTNRLEKFVKDTEKNHLNKQQINNSNVTNIYDTSKDKSNQSMKSSKEAEINSKQETSIEAQKYTSSNKRHIVFPNKNKNKESDLSEKSLSRSDVGINTDREQASSGIVSDKTKNLDKCKRLHSAPTNSFSTIQNLKDNKTCTFIKSSRIISSSNKNSSAVDLEDDMSIRSFSPASSSTKREKKSVPLIHSDSIINNKPKGRICTAENSERNLTEGKTCTKSSSRSSGANKKCSTYSGERSKRQTKNNSDCESSSMLFHSDGLFPFCDGTEDSKIITDTGNLATMNTTTFDFPIEFTEIEDEFLLQ
ncbi:uncharacterized protein LOC105695845 isoform X2 [Orussus abietinus]|uniref:uncharacterized protein LOC105695845 isoform X2 n=1 Tax=Orussus abietinus TaxID=222816 RepID=UPI00062616B0|nr:uncharacterized protein LOC105695845 isoform X2 [Orussus abietinus]